MSDDTMFEAFPFIMAVVATHFDNLVIIVPRVLGMPRFMTDDAVFVLLDLPIDLADCGID